MSDKSTALGNEILDQVVTLRMNKQFYEKMLVADAAQAAEDHS